MSILSIDLEMVVASVVEAMLPRFSDHKLGLLFGFNLAFDDYGYGKDGNTMEREPLHVRRFPWMLFVRPSNYTKVFFWEDKDPEVGFGNPMYNNSNNIWDRTSDHDSCWRTDGFRPMQEVYFDSCALFKDRGLRPMDVKGFSHFNNEPKYVELTKYEKLSMDDSDFHWTIEMKGTTLDCLEQIAYQDKGMNGKEQTFRSGMLIKGSEDHQRYITRRDG